MNANQPSNLSIVHDMLNNGYAHVRGDYYARDGMSHEIKLMQSSYQSLMKDNYSPGNRYRSYQKLTLQPSGSITQEKNNSPYHQSINYNSVDGDKKRVFSPISESFINTATFKHLLNRDIDIVKQTGLLDIKKDIVIGLHQIRYLASNCSPSYSSPLWLHKDDESVVFIHLFNISKDILGGDLLISHDRSTIDKIIFLEGVFDTAVVTKKHYHALTAIGAKNEEEVFRDILLITFS